MNEQYETVIVPLDGSPAGAECLQAALGPARQSGARLLLLRVIAVSTAGNAQRNFSQPQMAEREYNLRRAQAEGYLAAVKRWLEGRGVDVETQIEAGIAVATILDVAVLRPRPVVVIRDVTSGSLDPDIEESWPVHLSLDLARAGVPTRLVSTHATPRSV